MKFNIGDTIFGIDFFVKYKDCEDCQGKKFLIKLIPYVTENREVADKETKIPCPECDEGKVPCKKLRWAVLHLMRKGAIIESIVLNEKINYCTPLGEYIEENCFSTLEEAELACELRNDNIPIA